MTEMTERDRLVRIETIVEGLDEKFDQFLLSHRDHDKRIRRLEFAVVVFGTSTGLLGFDWIREALATIGA